MKRENFGKGRAAITPLAIYPMGIRKPVGEAETVGISLSPKGALEAAFRLFWAALSGRQVIDITAFRKSNHVTVTGRK